jgi:1-acyl-sn-glycerol-3-phosphate acyltransferase
VPVEAPALPYRGPEYVAHVEGRLSPAGPDPLLHLDPYRPPWLYRFGVRALRLLLPILFDFHVEGLDNIPPPPYIIACNHQRWFDPLFIAAAFPRLPMVYSMAKRATVFNRGWKRAIVPLFGVFPISPSRGHLDEQGIACVYEVLSRRGVVLIFPEGRYSRGRQLRPLKKGVAHFSLQSGVPITPVAISGMDRLRLRGPVTVSIGRPILPVPPLRWRTTNTISSVVQRVRRGILRAFGRDEEHELVETLRGRMTRLLRLATSRPGR